MRLDERGICGATDMPEPMLIREWGGDAFHRRVLELEARGYVARLETYRITPEVNPETGEIIHLHTIEMLASPADARPDST